MGARACAAVLHEGRGDSLGCFGGNGGGLLSDRFGLRGFAELGEGPQCRRRARQGYLRIAGIARGGTGKPKALERGQYAESADRPRKVLGSAIRLRCRRNHRRILQSCTPLTVHTSDSLTYRSDFEGLRAFAVIAVIAFHANERLLSGGFAGVDIFFVISGFLISGQIARDVGKGTFTFSNFYNRRIKRILPVYAVVSLFVSLASLYLLNTNDLVYFTTSLAASWLFASNVFFALLSGGYFDVHVKLFPLLHTWSLGVEEQFYFVFPVLFVVLLRRQRRHALMIACALLIAFVAISQLNSAKPSSYYLLQYRAHELLIGIISFLLTRDAPIRRAAPANVLCAAGLLLMIGSLVLLSPNSVYPGVNSLYPCIGAGLVIYSGHKAKLFHPLLMNRVIVFVGLISYSLYLWHWPVFSLLQYRGIRLSPLVTLAAISAITAMSCISW